MKEPPGQPPGAPDQPTFRPPGLGQRARRDPKAPPPPPTAAIVGTLEFEDVDYDYYEDDDAEEQRALARPGVLRAQPRTLPVIGTFGDYSIVGRLALGGMAEILLARDGEEGRHVVVKRILPDHERDASFVEMFLDEARVAESLKHPNICEVHRYGEVDGAHFIAMDWVDGVSLGRLIRRARKVGGVPPAQAARVAARVAAALAYAHDAVGDDGDSLSLVHRDVTPDNIMIGFDGAVKLLDFGIAKVRTRLHKTQSGVLKGKFAYMAPEQCRGHDLDRRADLFALGVCFYETLTGRPLYVRDNEFETMEAIVRGPVPKLAARLLDPHPHLEAIVARCLAKDRDDRYADATELKADLLAFLETQGELTGPADLAAFLDDLFKPEKHRGPILDTQSFGSSYHLQARMKDKLPAPTVGPPALRGEARLDVTSNQDAMTDAAMGDGPVVKGVDQAAVVGMARAAPTPSDNPRPGHAPLWEATEGPGHPLANDPRPAPAPPARVRPTSTTPGDQGPSPLWPMLGLFALMLAVGAGVAGVWLVFFSGPSEPPVEAPAPVFYGAMEITTEPTGARVLVDDEERGHSPVTVRGLSTGAHRVRFTLEGYTPHEGPVEIRADATTPVHQVLSPTTPAEAVERRPVSISTSRPAVVVHDGRELGATPLRNIRLPVGVVRLRFRLEDGRELEQGVMVRSDGRTAVHVEL